MSTSTKTQTAKLTREQEQEALHVLKNLRLLDSEVAGEHRCALEASPYLTDNWVEEIRRLWAQGAASTLALARIVCHARTTMAYGEWTRLWQPGLVPFSKRKAEMLAGVGSADRLAPLGLSKFAAFTLSPENLCPRALVALHPEFAAPFDFHQSEIQLFPTNPSHL